MPGIDQSRDTGGLAHCQCYREVEVPSVWESLQRSTQKFGSQGRYVHHLRNREPLAAVSQDSELGANSYGFGAGSA